MYYNPCGQNGYTSVPVNDGTSVERCCRTDNGNYPYPAPGDVVTIDPCSSATDCTTNSQCNGCT